MTEEATNLSVVERVRKPLTIEYAVPVSVAETLQQAADERAEAADLIEQLQAEKARREWQPIETAPRDGTHILLVEDGCVTEGRYVVDACRWFERNAHPTDAWDGEIYRPTHWMPLPEPPNPSPPSSPSGISREDEG